MIFNRWCVGAVLAVVAFEVGATAEPYTPTDDAVVLEKMAETRASSDGLRELRAQQRALLRAPGDLGQAAVFARRAIELGRAEADPRFFGYAEAALAPWIALERPPDSARLLRATLRQQRHDFAGALADLDVLIATNPANAQARLTRAVVLMVQGRPAQALPDCASLVGRTALIPVATCVAQARSLDGNAAAASMVLRTALKESAGVTTAERIWALTTLAEIDERRGLSADAERCYRKAIELTTETGERDPYLLTAYADFLLAQQRPDEARTLLRDSDRIDNALLRLTLAEIALADPAASAHIEQLDARFTEAGLRGSSVHLREQAMFELKLRGNPARAAELAAQNWQSQREPADALLLMEAALASGRPSLALPVTDWMARTRIEDPALRALAARLPPASPAAGATP